MPATARKIALMLTLSAALGAASTRAAESMGKLATFPLAHVSAQDAVIAVRSLGATRSLRIVDDHTLAANDTPEHLALVQHIVALIDATHEAVADTSFPAGDGTKIACIVLRHASKNDVMKALRTEGRIARFSLADDRVLVRDTDAQVLRAIDIVHQLDAH